jgi:hypothetical protein
VHRYWQVLGPASLTTRGRQNTEGASSSVAPRWGGVAIDPKGVGVGGGGVFGDGGFVGVGLVR